MRQSWNQSRQVMRLPVQLWKYSCAITRSMAAKVASVAVSGDARIRPSLKMLRPLFSIAPMLKSGHGDDVEHAEVVFAPEALLVPAHRALERIHGPGAAALLAGLDVDAQIHLAPGRGGEVGGVGGEIAADEGEQVAGLGVRVAPHRVVPLSAVERAALERIAVGEQHGGLVAVGLDAGGVGGEHVGAIEEVGDAAEALGLALRAVDAAREVEAGQRLVGLGIAVGDRSPA